MKEANVQPIGANLFVCIRVGEATRMLSYIYFLLHILKLLPASLKTRKSDKIAWLLDHSQSSMAKMHPQALQWPRVLDCKISAQNISEAVFHAQSCRTFPSEPVKQVSQVTGPVT